MNSGKWLEFNPVLVRTLMLTKPKGSQTWPITANANNAVNQSEVVRETCHKCLAREKHATGAKRRRTCNYCQGRENACKPSHDWFWLLFLIGWKKASFLWLVSARCTSFWTNDRSQKMQYLQKQKLMVFFWFAQIQYLWHYILKLHYSLGLICRVIFCWLSRHSRSLFSVIVSLCSKIDTVCNWKNKFNTHITKYKIIYISVWMSSVL